MPQNQSMNHFLTECLIYQDLCQTRLTFINNKHFIVSDIVFLDCLARVEFLYYYLIDLLGPRKDIKTVNKSSSIEVRFLPFLNKQYYKIYLNKVWIKLY